MAHARDGRPDAAGRLAALLTAALVMAGTPAPGDAQPVTERTPNLAGTWVSSPWNLHFQFAHRFQVIGAGDADVTDLFGDGSVINYPTFDLSLGLVEDAMAGVRYSSNSLVGDKPNEWQPYVKYAPLRGVGEGALSLAGTLAWNGASQSLDGEVAARTELGPVLLLGAVRGFSDAFAVPGEDEAVALAGGAGVRLNEYVMLGGDVAEVVTDLTDRTGTQPSTAWSVGLQVGIPATPHTFSLQATNVRTATLEGASVGDDETVFWGFEFTVPFSGFARWGTLFSGGDEEPAAVARTAPAGVRTVEVRMSELSFAPDTLRVPAGTTVRWVNRDPVGHTTTSDAGRWSSPLIGPGETWSRTFREPGRYPFHCTPHPFMEGVVIVESSERQP